MLLDIPERIEAERIYLRSYQAGDGQWYYTMGQKNRSHLARYEAHNVAMSLKNEQDAEEVVREFAADWKLQNSFFMAAFDRQTDEFVAQIYIGTSDWEVPEFEIGFFVDKDHEGQGYVTEAVKAALRFIFEHLEAHRVRMECDDTNERSRRVAGRCGLVLEGHIRQNKRNADDRLSGTLHFGLLKEEFEALYKNR